MTKERNQKIAILGNTGAGKTCFIAGLRWLGDAGCSSQSSFSNVVAPSGSCATYLNKIQQDLAAGFVPEGTALTTELDFEETYKGHAFHFSLFDYKGMKLKEDDLRDSPEFKAWAECDYLLVLLDPERNLQDGYSSDVGALFQIMETPEFRASEKKLAILLTKSDNCEQAETSALELLREKRPNCIENIARLGFKGWGCFYVSSLGGAPANGRLSGMPQPKGYEALFDWLVDAVRKEELNKTVRTTWNRVRWPVAVLVLLAGIAGGVQHWKENCRVTNLENAQDSSRSRTAQAQAFNKLPEKDRNDVAVGKLEKYGRELTAATSIDDLQALLNGWDEFWRVAELSETCQTKKNDMEGAAHARIESLRVAAMKGCVDRQDCDAFDKLLEAYENDGRNPRRLKREVDSFKEEMSAVRGRWQKKDIRDAWVVVGEVESLKRRLRMIEDYKLFAPSEKAEADQAVKDMRRLLEGTPFKVKSIQVGDLEGNHRTFVFVESGGNGERSTKDWNRRDSLEEDGVLVTKYKSHVAPFWDEEGIVNSNLSWKPGDEIHVAWIYNAVCGIDRVLADVRIGDWYTAPLHLFAAANDHREMEMSEIRPCCQLEDIPWIKVVCDEFPNPKRSLELIKKYVNPGTYWDE